MTPLPKFKYHLTETVALDSVSFAQLPDVPCEGVLIKASTANTGMIYVCFEDSDGNAPEVGTIGAADVGFQLDAGESMGYFPIDNASRIYVIGDSTSDYMAYHIMCSDKPA